ncbi:hypothetical protein [Streptomyces thermospinosisporus]
MNAPEPTQEDRYEAVERLSRELRELQRAVSEKQEALYKEIFNAFPENRGEDRKRGVLAELSRRSGWTREYVAQIRDGKMTGGTPSG